MHAGLLEALTNDSATARLDDPGTDEELLLPILGEAHAGSSVLEVAELFAEGFFAFGRAGHSVYRLA